MIEVDLRGPFSWPKLEKESGLPEVPGQPGLYVQTFNYKDGFIVHFVGYSEVSICKTLQGYTGEFKIGRQHILDVEAAQKGIRKHIWEGWKYNEEKREAFAKHKDRDAMIEAAIKQMAAYRIFIGGNGLDKRTLQRLKAKLIQMIYKNDDHGGVIERHCYVLPWKAEDGPLITAKINSSRPIFSVPVAIEI